MPAMRFQATLTGLDKLKKNTRVVPQTIMQAVADALYRCANEIRTNSLEVVPMKTGALASTATVTKPVITPEGTIETTVGYGGPSVKYAAYVHEMTDPNINWTRPGSGPKYLENPAKEYAPRIAPNIVHSVRRALK